MAHPNCPICFTTLEDRNVAPCWDCGHQEREIEDLVNEEHTFAEYRIFGDHQIVLCSFCDVDFGSHYLSYFGFPETGKLVGASSLEYIRDLPKPWLPQIDKFCPACEHRLKFLSFRAAILSANRTGEQAETD